MQLAPSTQRTLAAGTAATLATAALSALLSKRRGQSAAAPMNAVSHIVHGEKAARRDGLSLKYTLLGLGLNYAANTFWGALHQRMAKDGRSGGPASAIARGAATAATAYLIDYYVVPHRLRPGFEKRMGKGDRMLVFAALALALPLGEMLSRKAQGED